MKRGASRKARSKTPRTRRRRPSGRARATPGPRSRRDAKAGSSRRKTEAEAPRQDDDTPFAGAPGTDDPAEEALTEATELGLLLADQEEDEPELRDEDDLFFRAPPRNPAMPRVRPAPEIVKRRAGAAKQKAAFAIVMAIFI